MGLIAALAAVIFVADQISKYFALQYLRAGAPVPVVDGVFSLTLVLNPGRDPRVAPLDGGTPLGGRPRPPRRARRPRAARGRVLAAPGAGSHLRGRRRQSRRPGALRRGGGLPGLLLARLPLARVQRGGLGHQRGRHPPRPPYAGRGPRQGLSGAPVAGPAPRQPAATVAAAEVGLRLDRWLNARLPDLSRTRVQALVE